MNRTLFGIYMLLHTAFAAAQGSGITIHAKNISLKDVFSIIEQQTAYTIAYRQISSQLKTPLSLSLDNVTIEKALSEITKTLHLSYKIKGYHIIIIPRADEKEIINTQTEKPTQTIRGRIIDGKSGIPIEYATVGLTDYPTMGTTTNDAGNFILSAVPVGRHNLKIYCMGYETQIVPEILLTSSKEAYLTIPLTEDIRQLDEVVVYPAINKEKTLNSMAITGGRMINMEEAARFANGFDDPARLVTAFAGVAGEVGSNALIIRGNSPLFTQWRLEGVEIPNPNHFADVAGLGGGFLSALSTHVIGNSDFLNGTFPAEYDNALSGVFDMHMRNGNNMKNENTIQIGQLGVDVASEGPISKKQGSSYLFNYRFSDTKLVNIQDLTFNYQDLSFKLNFPTHHRGTFSVWGLGLIDRMKTKPEKPSDWETQFDRQSYKLNMYKYVAGLSHKQQLNHDLFIKSSLAITYSEERATTEQQTYDLETIEVDYTKNIKNEIVLNSYLNKQFGSKHTNRTGITLTAWTYELHQQVSPDYGLNKPMIPFAEGVDESFMLSVYSSSVIDLTRRLSASIGVSGQYYSMNTNMIVEPRLALKWKFGSNHSLAASYGLHSKRERLANHFIYSDTENDKKPNKKLNFSKAHHIGLTWNWNISSDIHFKAEPYYQSLFNIPVEKKTSFSLLNHRDYFMDRMLTNDGKGRNYGIDLTLERYLRQGYYYMTTLSLFKSEYLGGDKIWRPTRMDRNFMMNLVGGKEWMVGKQKQNMLNINMRLSLQGGERYTPVDEEKSHAVNDIVLDETKAFSKRYHPCFTSDLSASYKINKARMSHEFSVKLLNVTGYTGAHYYEYNEKYNAIKKVRNFGLIPNISYRIQF